MAFDNTDEYDKRPREGQTYPDYLAEQAERNLTDDINELIRQQQELLVRATERGRLISIKQKHLSELQSDRAKAAQKQ